VGINHSDTSTIFNAGACEAAKSSITASSRAIIMASPPNERKLVHRRSSKAGGSYYEMFPYFKDFLKLGQSDRFVGTLMGQCGAKSFYIINELLQRRMKEADLQIYLFSQASTKCDKARSQEMIKRMTQIDLYMLERARWIFEQKTGPRGFYVGSKVDMEDRVLFLQAELHPLLVKFNFEIYSSGFKALVTDMNYIIPKALEMSDTDFESLDEYIMNFQFTSRISDLVESIKN
jgi:hypothetical protein